MSVTNLSFPENRVAPPVCPVPAPSTGRWQRGGRPALEQSHIPGGVVRLVPAATLEVMLLNSHELWNVSGHLQSDCHSVNDTGKLQGPQWGWLVFQLPIFSLFEQSCQIITMCLACQDATKKWKCSKKLNIGLNCKNVLMARRLQDTHNNLNRLFADKLSRN